MRVKSLATGVVLALSALGLMVAPRAGAATPATSPSGRPALTAAHLPATKAPHITKPARAQTVVKHAQSPAALARDAVADTGPRHVMVSSADAAGAGEIAVPASSTPPDSLIGNSPVGYANMRGGPCVAQNPSEDSVCFIVDSLPVNTPVLMRCWLDTQPPSSSFTSPRWFYVTDIDGDPQNSGWVYSAYVIDQISTPNCNAAQYVFQDYPVWAPAGNVEVAPDNTNDATALVVTTSYIPFGPATVYCHLGGDNYPTGGSVTDLGTYTLSGTDVDSTFTIPLCGYGTQWVGVIGVNGQSYYSSEIGIGAPAPPPTPGYLEGIAGQPLTFSTTSGYQVGSTITVTGYPAENFGQTAVTVQNLALAVTSPAGGTDEVVCYTNLTVSPGQIVYCPGAFTPDVAGSWALNLDWQGSDGNWHDLYEPLYIQIAAAPPAPANDDFANATDLTGLTSFSGTTVGATAEPGEPDHLAGYAPSNSVWYKFTASVTGRAWVTMDDTDYAPVAVAAYTGEAVDELTQLAAWDGNNNDAIAFLVTQGEVYYFAIDDYGYTSGGDYAGTLELDALNPPANDDFANAQPITPGDTYSTDFDDATTEPGEPVIYPGEPDYGTAWYSYTPGPDQDVTMTLTSPGGTGGVVAGLFTGTSLSALNEVDYDYLDQGPGSSWTVTLSAGQTYYIALDDYIGPDQTSGIPDGLQFDLQATVAPVNDDFAGATDITGTSQFSGDNTYATAEPGEPSHLAGYPAANSVWFKFTASASGRAWVRIDNSKYGATALAAYSGDALDDLTQLAAWDGNNDEAIAFKVTAGNEYYLAVDDYGTIPGGVFAGTYEIDPIVRPGNDNFASAQPVTPGVVYATDLTDATVQPGEPQVVPGYPNVGSVWYSYRPAEDVTLTLSSPGGDATEGVGIFTGTSLASLHTVGWTIMSQGPSTAWSETLSAGITYYIAIANYIGPDPTSGIPQPGKFQLLAKVRPEPPVVTTTLPTFYSKVRYSIQLHAKDGTAPYTWHLARPAFLAGFSLSSSGVLSGAATGSGSGTLYVSVTDSENPKVTYVTQVDLHVVRDTTPPSGQMTKITTARGSVTVYWTASDKQSGYDYAQIRIQRVVTRGKQPAWVSTSALHGTSATVRITTTAQYRIEIRFADKSGNVSAWSPAKIMTVHA
jgi:hypothetical protein